MSGELLLEVRCEEIPAHMLKPGVRALATRLFEELMARRIPPAEVSTAFTPRRLVVMLEGLATSEPDREETVTGPPVSAAFDSSGAPTAALEGFSKRCGVAPEDLERVETPKGEYLAATRHVEGRPTSHVLSELLPTALAEINWPKSMRWGAGKGPWVRPVHSIVALLDGEVVPFDLFDVSSGRSTLGHPLHSPVEIEVSSKQEYLDALLELDVVVAFEARRDALLSDMETRAAATGGRLVGDDALIDKLASICETPGVVLGDLDRVDLPREVLITSLRDHQSALTVERDGELLPYFLTVMDRADDPDGRVQRGNEWVVAARLDDARFFYGEDRKRTLESRLTDLERVTFHEALGSYADKTARIVDLAAWLCSELSWEEDGEAARAAAGLLKVDLTTEMVKEFTSLQGVMGGVYAREEEQPEVVWQAVYDQYLPVSASDAIPRHRVGQIVSLADRIDTLVGLFGCGLIPTGSKDPFGLRRVAQGAVRIVLEAGIPIHLERAVLHSIDLFGERLESSSEEVLGTLRPFLMDRLRYLLGKAGFAHDEIEAALAVGGDDLPDLHRRVEALHAIRGEEPFLAAVLAAKRITNILKSVEEVDFDEDRLLEPAEKDLFSATLELEEALQETEDAREYEKGFSSIAEFGVVLDRFFVEVLVMDENLELRTNRLALLQRIDKALSRAARLTEMVVDRSDRAESG